jgi:tetratricopeptide (TPR) repeat protein
LINFIKYLISFLLPIGIIFSQDFSDIDNKIVNFNLKEAKVYLEELDKNSDKNIEILTRLSIVHHFLSESAEDKSTERKNAIKAFEYIEKAYTINPKNPKVLKWYVIALGKTVEKKSIRKQIEESKNIEKIALSVIELLPDDEYCYNILGQWHYRLADLNGPSRKIASFLFSEPPEGSFIEAQFFLEQSIKINPDYIGTYYWLGKTYLKINKKQKAIELFKVGIALDRPFKREEEAYQAMKSYLNKL